VNENPLVSVVIIFLNAERFIEEAIESVLKQTYPDWELILVDDGSTDGSAAVAQRFVNQAPSKIRYLAHADHRNHGMSASRNLGIAHARGEYIAFLDADDVWLANKLEEQAAVLRSEPEAGMVYGPTQWWFSWTGRQEDRFRDYIHELGVQPNALLQSPLLLARFLRTEGISPCTCSVLVRREVAERVGGFEEQFDGLYEDQAFFAKVCLAAPIYVSSACLAKYRQRPKSNYSVTQGSGAYDAARRKFLQWLEAYLKESGVSNGEVWRALRSETRKNRYSFAYGLIQRAREGLPGKLFRAAQRFRLRWLSLPLIRHLRGVQLRRLRPLGNGRQQGTAIVRYYWAQFLQKHRSDIRGRALEIGTTSTLSQYGRDALTCADAIDLKAHSPEVTVVADLSRADHVPADVYDCFVNQFTTHLIHDIEAALYHAVRILKPGGVLLINFPCVDYYFPQGLDMGTGSPLFLYWWFTPIQVENLFQQIGLDRADYRMEIYGNLFTRIAYQMNMPAEELTAHELEYQDRGHPLLICARIVKPKEWKAERPVYREAWRPDVNPAHWNPETGHYGS
jgi:glycosyltransferase involved in cell wall biosynthesis